MTVGKIRVNVGNFWGFCKVKVSEKDGKKFGWINFNLLFKGPSANFDESNLKSLREKETCFISCVEEERCEDKVGCRNI